MVSHLCSAADKNEAPMSMAADREEDSWLNSAEREDHDEYMAAKNRKKRATEMIDKIISAENIDDDVEVAARAVEILESLQYAFELLDAADNGLVFPETVAPLVVSFLITNELKVGFSHLESYVELNDKRSGILRFVGLVHFCPGVIAGVELDEPYIGDSDGTKDGWKYIHDGPKDKIVFVKKTSVWPCFFSPKKKKLSRKLVELTWKRERGQAEGPDDACVCRVMEKSKRQCGVKREQMGLETGTDALSKIEAQRICKAFMRKSNKTIDQLHPDVIFYYLDTNNDGVLDKSEVAAAMKAMWLMSTDSIRVELLLDDYDRVL